MRVLSKEEFENQKDTIRTSLIENKTVFIYPTDTVYGIGCNATNKEAVQKIRDIKQRKTNPFSVIVPSKEWIEENCIVNDNAKDWVKRLPGPYTIVLAPRKPEAFPEPVISPVGMVGFRVPRHPFIQAAFQQARGLVISTSVNRSGQPPLQDPEAIIDSFGPDIDLLIDGGLLPGSRGSTVVNPAVQPWQIIRQGDGKL